MTFMACLSSMSWTVGDLGIVRRVNPVSLLRLRRRGCEVKKLSSARKTRRRRRLKIGGLVMPPALLHSMAAAVLFGS